MSQKYYLFVSLFFQVSFDMSLARGLDYYTGVIYETVLKGKFFYSDKHTQLVNYLGGFSKEYVVIWLILPLLKMVQCVFVYYLATTGMLKVSKHLKKKTVHLGI